ncbi:MAG: UvrD-helicase domain-containing protein [Bacilli bacterium]|nr:UvrD-helicase domain-containing protein [Bacilli bacterium]
MPNWTKEQQQAILEKGKNIIVSAGAGSGKTAVLTERVITHLKNGVDISDLLILTFTNAAAAEMKDRIRTKIKDYEQLIGQLDKIDSAYITTFDAFALSLVKRYSYLLNIPKDITIIESSFINLKKEEILNELFEGYYTNKDEYFLKLIDDFSVKNDKEIFENIISLYNKISNTYDKESYLKDYTKNHYDENRINSYIDEYIKYIQTKKNDIKDNIKNLSLYVDGTYIERVDNLLNSFFESNSYENMKNNIITKLPNMPRGSEEDAKDIKKELVNKLKEVEELLKYENEKHIKQTLYKTKGYTKIITEILLKLDKRLFEYKLSKNAYEFIDISNMAIDLLKNNEEVKNELKEKFYEIMIDEYQDTNDLQEMFTGLIEKNNVYMVGDIKQSIYRFRNTNPKLFKDKYNLYSKGEKGIKIDLNKNFRSRNEVLYGINKLFDKIMDEDIGGAEYRHEHRMIFGNSTYNNVNRENYDLEILNYIDLEEYSKEEIEAFTIASDIKQKVEKGYEIMGKDGKSKKIKYEDFAILMDRSSSFNMYKKIFEYLQIPLAIYRDKKITDSKDIKIINNIYTLIINIHSKNFSKDFKYSFISVSRSYLYQTDDDIIIKSLNNYRRTDLFKKCENLSKSLDEKTNEQLIKEIIDTFEMYKMTVKDADVYEHLTILDSLIKIAQNLDELGCTPYEFKEYLTNILEKGLDIKIKLNKGSKDAVKIMTIHTSKGLEYPLCYYSGLFKEFNISDLKQKFYYEKKYGIITPYVEEGLKTSILKILLKRNYLKEEISEKLRLFYVALTRAREKMIIVTSITPKEFKGTNIIDSSVRLKYLSFKDIIDSAYEIVEKYIKNVDTSNINLSKSYNISKKSFNKNKFMTEMPMKIEEINIPIKIKDKKHFSKTTHNLHSYSESKNIEMGLKMHEIFERFDFSKEDYTNLSDFEIKKIKSFIKTGILKDAISIIKEYEFIYEEKETTYHGIIDLLILKKKENIIVDYKLKNINDKEYINQLNGYKKYIENVTNKPTQIYLYSILDEEIKQL